MMMLMQQSMLTSCFHLYAGDVQLWVIFIHAFPNKNPLHFTEQWTGSSEPSMATCNAYQKCNYRQPLQLEQNGAGMESGNDPSYRPHNLPEVVPNVRAL